MDIETKIERLVDINLTRFDSGPILYYPYVSGAVDIYKQRTKSFGAAVSLVGRAILNPTKENVSLIGNEERYDVAFLFSRLEMIRKFPTASEGEWIDVSGEFSWWNRRYKIEKVAPSGQVGATFSLVIALGMTIQGSRD
jgi:hypothetical protein